MDAGMSTVIAVLISAAGAVLTAVIGHIRGREKGINEGYELGRSDGYEQGSRDADKHSIEGFLDVYERDVRDANIDLRLGNNPEARARAEAIVANVKTWRGIQEHFAGLLDGLIDTLDDALQNDDATELATVLLALQDAFPAKRVAIETELKKSET